MLNILKNFTKSFGGREICCISTGRTGTNYLLHGLSGVNNLLVNWEILNPCESYINEKIKEAIYDRHRMSQAAINKMALENKKAFFRLLRRAKDDLKYKYMIYKIFVTSGHISIKELENFVIAKKYTRIFFLIRNPLKVYLSLLKARKLGVWGNVNTGDISVKFDEDDFMRFFEQTTKMYADVAMICQRYGKSYPLISYEEIFSKDTQNERIRYFVEKLNQFFELDLDTPQHVKIGYKKQDNSSLSSSIENFSATKTFLEQKKLGSLLEESEVYKASMTFLQDLH